MNVNNAWPRRRWCRALLLAMTMLVGCGMAGAEEPDTSAANTPADAAPADAAPADAAGADAAGADAAPAEAAGAAVMQGFFREHCLRCHGGEGYAEADVDLSVLNTSSLEARPDTVETLIGVLELGEMPPSDEPQPSVKHRRQLVAVLKRLLRRSVAESHAAPASPLRRMNRFQYSNAVQDLFQLNCVVFSLPERMLREHGKYFQPASGEMPKVVRVGSRPLGKSQMIEPRLGGVAAFPQDLRAEHGFDNRGDHLSLSPLLLEAFLRLSQSIVDSPDFGPRTVGIWKTFFAAPASAPATGAVVRQRLRPFLRRAFRRPVDESTLDRYAGFARSRLQAGQSFEQAMKAVASAVIASPKFLYLYDLPAGNDDGAADPGDDFVLASRLSFFLWGSIPDHELLNLAAAGRLHKRGILAGQVDRMLNDRKLKRFCDSFPAQWLQLDRIISSAPNRERFSDFYFSKYRTSMHMMLEPLLLFETVLIEDRPITDLIDPDFSYRSARLDRLYYGNGAKLKGRPNPVTVLPFTRVPVRDRRQGGVITNAAVMTMTSGPERTKPITRGAWMATAIFNAPPKPPPADVPPLEENPSGEEAQLTLRERLDLHRQRASCAGCHEKIDPLGFALENYGPTGKWRARYPNGRRVEPAGQLFGQHAFEDVVDFKDAILAERDRFARGFAGHLLSFALARGLTPADSITLDQVVEATAENGYRLRPLIKQLVLSDAFRGLPSADASSADASAEASIDASNDPAATAVADVPSQSESETP